MQALSCCVAGLNLSAGPDLMPLVSPVTYRHKVARERGGSFLKKCLVSSIFLMEGLVSSITSTKSA